MPPNQPNQQPASMPPKQTNQPLQPYLGPPMASGAVPPNANPNIVSARTKKHHPWGLIIALTLVSLLFLGAAGFGLWAFTSRQDYKDHSDKKAAEASAAAVKKEDVKKEADFLEREKNPLKLYEGPEAFGSIKISYPKTWGAYVVEQDRATLPIDGYFHPVFVPGVQSGTAFALRVQVTSQAYDTELKQFENKIKTGKVKLSPFVAKNVPGVTGSRLEGEINNGQKDVMILLPLRDKTLKISSESPEYVGDLDNIILPNLKFVP
ncbi:MAG TPA: hypothetical protein VLE74_02320 [Candidatus Saccharimonadales bacterium]|nr:hypothetical protein [Candidatus Saccharimonadales bacterium]